MNDAVIGTEVDGYRIQAVLGRGGMGTVYKAEDVNLSRTVALKRINPSQSDRESFIHRFRSEAQALARIDSPHIVGVYALRETDIGLLIVMEYVEGGTLKAPLENQGPMSPTQAIPILEQIMKAFDDAHSAGVIHRDIKPQNIMLTADGMVKITDFGIAKLRQPDSGETVTQGGQGGTLKYMSPEQISNISAVDARSDLYSIGMTAYEMLAGCLPFKESDTDFDIMRKVVEGEIPPPDEFNPDIPSGLAQWVVGAIQKAQDDRYQSAEEMLETLREADRQVDVTQTQPEWEVEDGSTEVEETQTVVPDDGDETQTIVPGDHDDTAEAGEPAGQTVIDPKMGSEEEESMPSSEPELSEDSVSSPTERVPEDASGSASWLKVGGALFVGFAALIVGFFVVMGYLGYPQGGGEGASATLSLSSTPSGATVLVNGDTAGTTPLQGHTLEAGAVQLQVEKEGHVSLDTSFTMESGGTVSLADVKLASAAPEEGDVSKTTLTDNSGQGTPNQPDATGSSAQQSQGESTETESNQTTDQSSSSGQETEQTAATGTIEVTPKPSGTVLVDGDDAGASGGVDVSVGDHTVTCRHPEHGSVQTTVSVSEGRSKALTCYFEQEVNVNTNDAWGRIWVNGRNTGQNTNANGRLSLSPGTYRIEVRRQSLDQFRVEGGAVKIERGEESRTEKFSGSSYQLEVEPTFTRVEYAIVFNVSGG